MPYFPPPSTGGSGTPGGSDTQVQYNNAGAFGGISGATSNGTNIFIPALYGSSSASGTLTLGSTTDTTKGTIGLDDKVKLWDSIPDAPGAVDVLTFNPTFLDNSGGASLNGYFFNPTVTTSGTLALNQLSAVKGSGTYSYGTNPSFGNLFQLFVAQPACTLNVAGGVSNNWTILSQQDIITGSAIAAGSTNGFYGFQENSRVGSTGAAGSVGFTHHTGFAFHPRMQAVTGGGSPSVTTITDLRGLWVKDVAKSGSGTNTVTRQTAIDVENLTGGATNISLRSQGSAVELRHAGPATFGGDSAPDTTLHLKGTTACATFEESSVTPANPTSGTQMRVYMRADKFIIQYNDGGTTRYKYLLLTGTGVTWTHTTTAPT